MPGAFTTIHITNPLGVILFVILWFVLVKCVHLLLTLWRHDPLLGWAIGPLGVTIMFLHEPSVLYIWLDVLCPAFVSATVVYIGLFTPAAPLTLPHVPLLETLAVACGVALSSTGDLLNALRDLRHPLWGEARVLRSIQWLRATWARIHFTPFGYSYLSDHFGSNPTDLLQAL
jgi:hypothetical protein